MKNILIPFVLEGIQRVLGLQDRNPLSSTYGCMDREFWQYKTIKEFPSATYQNAMLSLAMVYIRDFEGNQYYRSLNMCEWSKSALLYWTKIQHNDGSFDEWFLNEHSFCATAFTTFSAAQTYLLLRNDLDKTDHGKIKKALYKAGIWLIRHHNPLVSNQNMAALNALLLLYNILDETSFKSALSEKKEIILKSQSTEGWFTEYQGADIGYCFVAVDLLAFYLGKTRDDEINNALKSLLSFLKWFVHPDGTAGGFYGSRGSQYILLWGLAKQAKVDNVAAEILDRIRHGIKKGTSVTPNTVDDKYFSYFYINSWVGARIALEDNDSFLRREQTGAFVKIFKKARLCAMRTNNYYAVINLAKNGVFIFYGNDGAAYADAGYLAVERYGKQFVSHFFQDNVRPDDIEQGVDALTLKIKGNFYVYRDYLPLTKYVVPFKLACLTLFAWDKVVQAFNRSIKKMSLMKYRRAPVAFKRMISFERNRIVVKDELTGQTGCLLKSVASIHDSVIQESPAARTFAVHQLGEFPDFNGTEAAGIFNKRKKLNVLTVFDWAGSDIHITKKVVGK